jgi:hypothetical protein
VEAGTGGPIFLKVHARAAELDALVGGSTIFALRPKTSTF